MCSLLVPLDVGVDLEGEVVSSAKPKSDIEIKTLRAAETPGPGQYKLPQFGSGKGGIKISDANPLSDIDLKMIRASETQDRISTTFSTIIAKWEADALALQNP